MTLGLRDHRGLQNIRRRRLCALRGESTFEHRPDPDREATVWQLRTGELETARERRRLRHLAVEDQVLP